MAHWRGDGERLLGEAARERDLSRKVEKLIEANLLLYRELEFVLRNLGTENFCAMGLKEIREGEKD